MSKEIELKFKISEQVYKNIISDLNKDAKKIGESKLIDTYYIPNFKEFEINGVTQECVRIRQTEKDKQTPPPNHTEITPSFDELMLLGKLNVYNCFLQCRNKQAES